MELGILGNIFVFVGAIFVLVRSGALVVKCLINLARLLKIPEFILSFILMSFATTLPDFSIGVNAVLKGEPLLALGSVLGANIVTNGLILGFLALVSGRIVVDRRIAARDAWLTFALSVAPVILLLDGRLTRIEGGLLLILFLSYILKLAKSGQAIMNHSALLQAGNDPGSLFPSFFKNLVLFAVSAVLILGGAFFAVESAYDLSRELGVSGFIFSLFALGLATSIPELVFGLRSVIVHHSGLSLGNLIGAAAFNSTLILGTVAVISPIEIAEMNRFWLAAAVMCLILFFSHLFLRTGSSITRREGILLLTIYIIFVIFQFII